MLTISVLKEEDEKEVEKFIKEIENTTREIDNSLVMVAKDKDEIIGLGFMMITFPHATIEKIIVKEEQDIGQLDYGIGKAMLNYIDRRGIKDVYAPYTGDSVFIKLMKRLEFVIRDDNILYLNLENYFTSSCCDKEA